MLWSAEARARDRARAANADDRPSVRWSAGEIRLQNAPLFADPGSLACRLFLQRAFHLDEVRSVEIDRAQGSARIVYDPDGRSIDDTLDRLAASVRTDRNGSARARPPALPRAQGEWTTVRVGRFGTLLTTWEVVRASARCIRLRNEILRKDRALADLIVRELSAVHGVEHCHVGRPTASLFIRHEPGTLDARRLVRFLDRVLEGPGHAFAHAQDPPAVPFAVASAAVGLAAVGELAAPTLLPASALLLVATNVPTFRAAWDELRRRQIGLPVLATTIIAGTLASGQFLAAALMAWLLKFWQHRHRARLLQTRRSLLPGIAQHHRFARLETADGAEVLLDDLRPGHRIVVGSGEVIPADGRVAAGFALVDEGLLTGRDGLSFKRRGGAVYAGSRVQDGELRIVVERVGRETRAAAFADALAAASTPDRSSSAVTADGEAFARRAVVPTIATAGVGLLLGDLTTASAVLRPDYATGPGLGIALERLQDVAECARHGIIVREPSALQRLAEADVILFDGDAALARSPLEVDVVSADSEADERKALQYAATAFRQLADERAEALRARCAALGVAPLSTTTVYGAAGLLFDHDGHFLTVTDTPDPGAAAPAITVYDGIRAIGRIAFRRAAAPHVAAAVPAFRRDSAVEVGLLSSHSAAEADALGRALGIDRIWAGLSSGAKRGVIQSFRTRGLKVAYITDGEPDRDTAKDAHVVLTLAGDGEPLRSSAPIVVLGNNAGRLGWLWKFAGDHVNRIQVVHGSTLIPNLACVVGAFLFGFTSMTSVLITNLATWGIYARLPQRAHRRNAPRTPRPPRETRAGIVRYNGAKPWPEGHPSCDPILTPEPCAHG